MRRLPLLAAIAVALLAGCATAPDGSRIQRLPQPAEPPVLSTEQARALTDLNARVLREQDAARRDEEARVAQRRAYEPSLFWGLHYGRGWPYGGWGPHWHPHWGLDLWGPLVPAPYPLFPLLP